MRRLAVALYLCSTRSASPYPPHTAHDCVLLRFPGIFVCVCVCVCVLVEKSTVVTRCRLCVSLCRYDDMVESVRKLAMLGVQLTVEERNLLSVAYKNVVGARRASWRVLSSIESKERDKTDSEHAADVSEYRAKVEAELEKICEELLRILEDYLLPKDTTTEGTQPVHVWL